MIKHTSRSSYDEGRFTLDLLYLTIKRYPSVDAGHFKVGGLYCEALSFCGNLARELTSRGEDER
jgi:hypothetical protein